MSDTAKPSSADNGTPPEPAMTAKAIVSIVMLVIYAAAHYIAWKAGGTQLDIIIGADANMAAAVVFYWVGGSADSTRKTSLLNQVRPPAVQPPAPTPPGGQPHA